MWCNNTVYSVSDDSSWCVVQFNYRNVVKRANEPTRFTIVHTHATDFMHNSHIYMGLLVSLVSVNGVLKQYVVIMVLKCSLKSIVQKRVP